MTNFDINKIEEEILEFWEKQKAFGQSLKLRQKKKSLIFFEGPPTANGRPGIHHFFGRALKDLFCRYWTMRGFYVERKSGWDTHGLPVEIEVEKMLGLKSKKEIEEYGIAKFNEEAKKSVWKYKEEWEKFTKRIGYWLDLNHPYITYEAGYIESLWWVVKKIWEKKLLWRGYKVVPFCPRCGTPLSSHEVAQGYQTVTDRAVTVKFLISLPAGEAGNSEFLNKFKIQNLNTKTYILAWTTTPWTLPGNVALAVGEKIKYVLVKKHEENYLLAKDRLSILPAGGEIIGEFSGKDLVGLRYQPLFDIKKLHSQKSYQIYPADFVTTTDGTGVVHTAVMYGEDDYQLGLKVGLPRHHTVDAEGKFTEEVPGLGGKNVKSAEGEIIRYLEEKNLLLKEESYTHEYPFCWRCRQSLLYYATDSWFIGMTKVEKKLIKNNQKINWYPSHLKNGRFGEWLRGIKDWAISRERYWGTPLPIWRCQKGHTEVVGSFEELEKRRWRKKNHYFLMRHGFSTKNGSAIISSRLENDHYPLTDQGRHDVKKQAKRLKKIGINQIYTSPFLRTKETAEIISEVTGVKVTVDERLKEIDHGLVCEGSELIRCLPSGSAYPTSMDVHFGDGESWNDVRRRTMEFIREIDRKQEGKNIVIVSHGDPLAVLAGTMHGWDDKDLLKVMVGDGLASSEKEGQHWFYPKKGRFYMAQLKNYPWDETGHLNPHRPYVDEVVLQCRQCRQPMHRIKEVMDVWFDSGAMPLAQWHYPFENKRKFKENFPAEFIAEAIDQTRGWFYTLLAVSTLLDKGAPYKNVISHGHVLDEKSQKMSKSRGNIVDPWEVIKAAGADATRWYFYSGSTGEPKAFSLNDVSLRLRSFVMVLINALRFFELYRRETVKFPFNFHKQMPRRLFDRWLLSRLHQVTAAVTRALDSYDQTGAVREIEKLVVEDFSQWWLRRSRGRFQHPASPEDFQEALSFLRFFLLQVVKILAPFTPFVAEHLHHELHKGSAHIGSVHWHDWPKSQKLKSEDEQLIKEMELVRKVSNMALALRQKEKIKVRQPLPELAVVGQVKLRPELVSLLKEELNVKEVGWPKEIPENFVFTEGDSLKVGLNKEVDKALRNEGWAREVVRQIQDMRKEAQYRFDEKVAGEWHSEQEEVRQAIEEWAEFIKEQSLLKTWQADAGYAAHSFDAGKEFALAPGQKIWLGVKK